MKKRLKKWIAAETDRLLFDKYKECQTCGGLFHQDKMHAVARTTQKAATGNEADVSIEWVWWYSNKQVVAFYCTTHKPPYDAFDFDADGETVYYRNHVEVTETGKIKK